MADEDLRKKVLTKPKVQRRSSFDEDNRSPLENGQNWEDARKAIASGWKMPERRFYVIISSESLVDTPQKLQEMANMTSAPEVVDTVYIGLHGEDPKAAQMGNDGKPKAVQVGEVSWEELMEIRIKTKYDWGLWVVIDGKVRGALMAKWFKTDKHEGEHEDGAGVREGSSGASP